MFSFHLRNCVAVPAVAVTRANPPTHAYMSLSPFAWLVLLGTGLMASEPAFAGCIGFNTNALSCSTAAGAAADSGNLTSATTSGASTATLQDWTLGNGSLKISNSGTAAAITVNADHVQASGSASGAGIVQISSTGAAALNLSNSSITQNGSSGYGLSVAGTGGATITVSNSSVSLNGTTGTAAIYAYGSAPAYGSVTSNATISLADAIISATMASANGVVANSLSGDAAITGTGGSVSVVNGNGLQVQAFQTASIDYSGDVTLSASQGTAISATGGKSVAINLGGTVSGGANGIVAAINGSSPTDIVVTANNVSSGTAITATNNTWNAGSKLEVTVNGAITSLVGAGITATASNNAATKVTVNAGSVVNAKTSGIIMSSGVTSTALIAGQVIAAGGNGLTVTGSVNATSAVTSLAGSLIQGSAYGINLNSPSNMQLAIDGTVIGTGNDGIVTAGGSNATTTLITGSSSLVSGGRNGINVVSPGDISMTIAGTVTGKAANGIYSKGTGSSKTSIATSAGSQITGQSNGLDIFAPNALNLTLAGSVTGLGGNGVNAVADGSAKSTIIVAETSLVQGSSNGLNIVAPQDLNLTLEGSVKGLAGNGVNSTATGGAKTTINAGATSVIEGGSNGFNIVAPADLSLTLAGSVRGLGGNGVNSTASGGATTTINASASSVITGSANGILASGGSNVTVSVAGAVSGETANGIRTSTGWGLNRVVSASDSLITGGSNGIAMTSDSGALQAEIAGQVTGSKGDGVQTSLSGWAATTVTTADSALVEGSHSGVNIAKSSASASIVNDGTIRNLSTKSNDLAIISAGGHASTATTSAVKVSNNGHIIGTLDLSGNAGNSLINASTGIWDVAGGSNWLDSVETGGKGQISNQGLINAAAEGATSAVTTTFSGISSFDNAGTLALFNGVAGDRAVINGNYNGSGGTLTLDTVLGDDNSLTDKLLINGDSSGSSFVRVVNAGGAGAATDEGIEIIAISGSSNGSFTLKGDYEFNGNPAVVAGTYAYQLYKGNRSGSDSKDWYLRSEMQSVTPPDPGEGGEGGNGGTGGEGGNGGTGSEGGNGGNGGNGGTGGGEGGTGGTGGNGGNGGTGGNNGGDTGTGGGSNGGSGNGSGTGGSGSAGNSSGSNEGNGGDNSGRTDPTTPIAPIYQAGVPTYQAYGQALLGMNTLSTLQQRIGNRYWAGKGNRVIAEGGDGDGAYASEAGTHVDGNGVWGVVEGLHNHIAPRLSTAASDYDQDIFRLQAGIDGMLVENEQGILVGGLFVHYLHGRTRTQSIYGDGEITSDGYGLGGTLTWYGGEGFYLDAQAQATWYQSDLNSRLASRNLVTGNDGFGYALSLETGRRIELKDGWSLTPQAQLVWNSVRFDGFDDAFGAPVRLDRSDSLQSRLGLTLDHETSWQNARGLTNRSHVYGIANLYYEFGNGSKADVAGVSFAAKQDRLWGGVGMGGSYNWDNDKYSIFGEAQVNTSLGNFGDSYSVKGKLGFQVKW